MKLIVGLGNPGKNYEGTRHNIGYMVIDKLAKEITSPAAAWEIKENFKSMFAKAGDVLLAKPTTYMNNSGMAVKAIVDYYKIDSDDLWVIHDDIDLPLGKIRIRDGGGTGGHNGIESVIKMIGSDKFLRFRLGIGRGKEDRRKDTDQNLHHRSVIDFVLSRFTQGEAGALRHLVKRGSEAVHIALIDGVDHAMQRFN
jgi:PTH1 family peptidyl-tRNA hydrolase